MLSSCPRCRSWGVGELHGPLHAERGERRPAGLPTARPAVVIASIASTSFDGAQEGAVKGAIESVFEWLMEVGFTPTTSLRLSDTIFTVLCFLGVAAAFELGLRGMRSIPGAPSLARLRTAFAHTLIPIALAYLVAHRFSLFVSRSRPRFTYLLSDPLGTGQTDLFGTAEAGIDFAVLGSQNHLVRPGRGPRRPRPRPHPRPRRALTIWPDPRRATRSQYWMLAVMAAFTCFGLYLLSAGNG